MSLVRSIVRSPIRSVIWNTLGDNASDGDAAPSFPITPLVDLDSSDITGVSKRYVPNRQVSTPASASHIQLTTGRIQGSGNGTQAYANGPGGAQTALRLQLPSGTGIWDFFTKTLAANTTLKFKAKSNAGAGAQAFSYGALSSTTATANVDESGWTTCSVTIASGASRRISIFHNSTTSDVLVDEIQLETGASAGTYATTPGHGCPEQAFDNAYTVTGGALDTTAAAVKSSLPLPSYPSTTAFTQATVWAVISTADATTIAGKIICATGGEGTFDIGTNSGNAYGQPALNRGSSHSGLRLVGKTGYHVLISTSKSGASTFYLDGIPVAITTTSLTSFTKNVLGFMGDPNQAGETWGQFGFKGKLTKAGIVGSWMTDAQVQQLYTKLKADHAATGETALNAINFVIAEGDSITALSTSYVFKYFDTVPLTTFGHYTAVSGTTLQDGTTGGMSRKAGILARVQAAVALGHNPIVSVLHGANGTYSMAQAHAFSDDLRTAGAKIIYCTAIHIVGDAAANSGIDTMNTNLIAEGSALYDGLARFDGVLTETVGVDYTDTKHPNSTGHGKLKPIWQAAVEALLV